MDAERELALAAYFGVMGVVGSIMWVRWGNQPLRYVTYGSGLILLCSLLLGVFFGVTDAWATAAGVWLIGALTVALGFLVATFAQRQRR
jgi:hypothetical protein